MAILCYTYSPALGKGKSDCYHTLLQVHENMGGIANEKLHVQLFYDDMNSTQMEEMLEKAGTEARGKQAGRAHFSPTDRTTERPCSSYNQPTMPTQQQ